jgi:hypothetical protein
MMVVIAALIILPSTPFQYVMGTYRIRMSLDAPLSALRKTTSMYRTNQVFESFHTPGI